MSESEEGYEWHTPQVNKDKVWRGYVDSYDNHAFGILQEDGQNSFDAYSPDTPAKDMKMIVKYDSDKRILYHRDFEASGMGHCRECGWGIKADKIECTNLECKWGCFHNMGYSGKGGTALGSRGMGKALHLLAGHRMVVRTTMPDGRHKASVWEKLKGDWQWRYAPEFNERLSSSGTELISYDVVDAVHEELLQPDYVAGELQERWFRLLTDGATIEYVLVKDGKKKRTSVKAPKVPKLDMSQGEDRAHVVRSRVVVKRHGKRLGELRNLNLFLAKRPFEEDDRTRGIAIVKNGKQTITRFRYFPGEIPEQIRNRIFGYCDAICTKENRFLQDAENATHTGYQWSHPTYKAVRRELRELVKEFVQPFLRAGGERVTEKEQEEAAEILEVLNKALEEVPEFGLFGKKGVSPARELEVTPKSHIYLSRVEIDSRMFTRGETIPVVAVVKNPTSQETMVVTTFEHFDPTPVVVEDHEDGVIVTAGTPENPGTNSIEGSVTFEQNQAPGIHWVQVSLHDVKREALIDEEGNPIRMRRQMYCELEPRRITRRRRTGTGRRKKGEGTGGGEGAFGFAAIQWFKKPELRDSLEAYIDMSQAVAFVNRRGRRLEYAQSTSRKKAGYWPIAIDVIGEKLVEWKARMDSGEKEDWQAEEVQNMIIHLGELKARLIRNVVGQLE
jgi:hypothetical protein